MEKLRGWYQWMTGSSSQSDSSGVRCDPDRLSEETSKPEPGPTSPPGPGVDSGGVQVLEKSPSHEGPGPTSSSGATDRCGVGVQVLDKSPSKEGPVPTSPPGCGADAGDMQVLGKLLPSKGHALPHGSGGIASDTSNGKGVSSKDVHTPPSP